MKNKKSLNVRVEGETNQKEESLQYVKETGNKGDREKRIKEIEAVLFIPATPGSEMKKLLQTAEGQGAKLMNSPTVRVVERAGTKLIQEVGSNNPWNKEWSCPRRTCLPCQGQAILGAEEEKEALRMADGGQEEQKTAR